MPGKASRKPPKEFFDKMSKRIRAGNPEYTDDHVNATVANIWYKNIGPKAKSKYNRIRTRREASKSVEHVVDLEQIEHIVEVPKVSER